MCKGFGGVITPEAIYFSEPDEDGDCSHSLTLNRLGWKENTSSVVRRFARFEFPDWTEESFRWDEDGTLPGWVGDEHVERAKLLLARVAPAWAEYEKVRAAAWAEYKKVCAPAWAEYKKVCAAAWAEYTKALSTITGYVPEM